MKKSGYTVAEAIITMAIIGVVASLTIPTFISSYKKNTYANTLSSAVSDFENAMQMIMVKDGVDDLLDTKAWNAIKSGTSYSLSNQTADGTIDKFKINISKTLPIDSYDKTLIKYSPLSNPNAAANLTYGNPVRLKTKKGIDYMIEVTNASKANAKKEIEIMTAGYNYQNRAGFLCIDVNGAKEPNIQGRDWFRFELGTDGKLYPYGGKDCSLYRGEGYASPKAQCVTNKDGHYCAAYLMENGYKMDY